MVKLVMLVTTLQREHNSEAQWAEEILLMKRLEEVILVEKNINMFANAKSKCNFLRTFSK